MSRAGSALPRPIVNSFTSFRAASSAAFDSDSPSVVWPSLKTTIADGGAPRSSVSTWRTPSPSRDCVPTGSIARTASTAAWNIDRAINLDELAGPARDKIEPHFVLLLQLAEQPGLVLQYQALGNIEPGGLRFRRRSRDLALDLIPGRRSQIVERGLDFGLVVLVDDPLAPRIVDQDRQIGQSGAADGKDCLGQHEHRQEHQRDSQAGEHHLARGRRLALAAVKPADQSHAPDGGKNQERLGPRLLEDDARSRLFAGLGRGHAKSIGQVVQDPVKHGQTTSGRRVMVAEFPRQ